ncbi:GRAM domain-containing protein 2B-like isoform X3 [Lagopus muta]|uniref:GRAM domain-containing protein 2B-like isoform X3 n=1 Tax=Lagopus muta TaxID=64668 RepID=UPI00209DC6B3|nr:GRAM domain-containing protein 2B-like isoform X3 [Lagopus muta]
MPFAAPPRPGAFCSVQPHPTPPCKPAAAGPSPACLPFLAGRRRRRKRRRRLWAEAEGTRGSAGLRFIGTGRDGRAQLPTTSTAPGCSMSRRLRRSRRLEKQWQSLEERGSAQPDPHPALARSRTYDASTCTETPEASGHPGSLNPAVVPVASVCAFKKTNTALLVPNALSIRTEQGDKFLFVSLRRREATYQLLKSLCRHLQDDTWSPPASPLNHSSEQSPTKSLTSSHSDLEQCTPEPDGLLEQQDEPNPMLNRAEEDEEKEEETAEAIPVLGRGRPRTALPARSAAQLCAFNTIIVLYLLLMVVLLLTSGYIGLRILELEQQLAAMGAWPELSLVQRHKKT